MVSPNPPGHLDHHARAHGGVPVRVLLVVLALLSLSGAIWLSAREFDRTSASQALSESVDRQAEELVGFADLRAALLDEHNWTVTAMGIADLGITNDTIMAMTGIDPAAELDRARTVVDEVIARTGSFGPVDEELRAIRAAPPDLSETSSRYLRIEDELRQSTVAAKRRLEVLAGDASNGGVLVTRSRELGDAVDARQAVAAQLTTYFLAAFATPEDLGTSLELLVRQQVVYERAMTGLEGVDSESRTASALADVAASTDAATFNAATLELIDELVSGGATAAMTDENLFGNLDEIRSLFEAGARSAEAHFAVVAAAQDDLDAATAELRARVGEETTKTLWTVAVLALASLLLTAILARFIGAPLRRLADGARRLRDGNTDAASPTGGPREVRLADAALREAAANLSLTQRQTVALANAKLDDPVLDETVPGGVGVALQEAVQHLATSLTEREQFRRRLAHEATHDGLSQLPNRKASLAHLGQGLARTLRSDTTLALLFLDLDGFKTINDRYGHQAGDEVLRVVAHRLVASVREGDHVGRFGGDEFLIVAEPVNDPQDAIGLAERLIQRLEEPIEIGEVSVEVSACIGIGLAHDDRLSVDELLRDADLAVYQAKAKGPGRIEVCDEDLKSELDQRADLHDAIVAGLARDELVLHYQPVIDSVTGDLRAVEALVRWERPDHGMVAPNEFIPFAERTGLIVDLDRWVMEHSIAQLAAWSTVDTLGRVPVAVNVSSRTVGTGTFADMVAKLLDEHQVDPARLIIEITESALLEDLHGAAAHLQRLRAKGVRVAIDDFGTGYTSLASLRQLPFDILKVDQSYTADVQYESLVKLIIDTGHLLGARITAEGVEDADQASRLVELGSDELQGYLYGRPCAPAELVERLTTDSGRAETGHRPQAGSPVDGA